MPSDLTWSIELGGAKLKKPVTISVPYEPGALLAGQDPASIVLAYRDGDTGRWIIVPSAVDPVTHTVTAEVTHLSDWGLFTVNWDYWIAFIGKVASGNLTDLLEAVGTLTTECETDDGVFEVSNKAANKLLKGCIRKVVDGRATIGVTNLRAIWLAIRSPASGGDDVAGPGDTITFKTGGAKPAQPVIASARMTETAFWYQLADLLVRLLPGGDELTKAASYTRMLAPLAEVVKRAFAGTQAYEKAKAGDGAAAVEALVRGPHGRGLPYRLRVRGGQGRPGGTRSGRPQGAHAQASLQDPARRQPGGPHRDPAGLGRPVPVRPELRRGSGEMAGAPVAADGGGGLGALAIKSLPSRITGIACSWIGVASSKPM